MWGMFVCVLCSPPTNLFWIFPKNERWQKDGEIAVNGLQCARCKRLTDFPDVSSKINISESITWIQKKKNPRLHNSNLTALRITSTWVIFYRRMAAVIMYRHPHPPENADKLDTKLKYLSNSGRKMKRLQSVTFTVKVVQLRIFLHIIRSVESSIIGTHYYFFLFIFLELLNFFFFV